MQAHNPRKAMDGVADLHLPNRSGTASDRIRSDQYTLRKDLDRALTRTMAYLYPLLLLQSIPSYLAQHGHGVALSIAALLLAASPCVLLFRALQRPAHAARVLLTAAALFVPITGVEAIEARPVLPGAYLPWLLVVAPIFIPSLALGARSTRTWVVGNLLGLAGVIVVYAPRLPLDRLVMTLFSISAFSIGAFVGVRALRRRADRADAAQLAAGALYDETQRRIALEQERVRTDALIHDSLLNALLGAVAAAGTSASRVDAVQRAREAVTVLNGTRDDTVQETSLDASTSIADALAHELHPLRGVIELRVKAGLDIELPPLVRDAIVSATLQAVNNSMKHAGPGARRTVTLERVRNNGLCVSVRDDGRGFDLTAVAAERLGVRVSILKRMETVGGAAQVLSAPGSGTEINLTWSPEPNTERPRQPATPRRLVHA